MMLVKLSRNELAHINDDDDGCFSLMNDNMNCDICKSDSLNVVNIFLNV
jgi:hypothetical protein